MLNKISFLSYKSTRTNQNKRGLFTGPLAWWLERSLMAWDTVETYQRLKKKNGTRYWTFSIIRYVWRVKWSSPGKGLPPSPTRRCSSYWKESLRVVNFTYTYIHMYEEYIYMKIIYIYIYIYIYIDISIIQFSSTGAGRKSIRTKRHSTVNI